VGEQLVGGGGGPKLLRWGLASLTALPAFAHAHEEAVTALACAAGPAPPRLFSASLDWSIRCFGLASTAAAAGKRYGGGGGGGTRGADAPPELPQLLATLQGHRGAVMSLASDAKHLYSGSVDRSVRVWDVVGLRQLRALFLPEMHAPVYGVAIARGTHAEGAQLLSASHDVRVCHSSRNSLARSQPNPTTHRSRSPPAAHGPRLGPRGEPPPLGCQSEAAAARWCLPKVADLAAFDRSGGDTGRSARKRSSTRGRCWPSPPRLPCATAAAATARCGRGSCPS